jgi:YggT family protein
MTPHVVLLSGVIALIFRIIYDALWIYFFILIARIVFDYIQLFNPKWRPSGFLLIVVELIYTVTDPPLRLMRRVIPPLRIGQVALDLSFLFVIIVMQVFIAVIASFL